MIKVGSWIYEPETGDLHHEKGAPHIDLNEFTNSARVLDLIMQQETKVYFTAEEIGDLVRIIHRLIDPQATLCSAGRSTELKDPRGFAAQRIENLSPRHFVARAEDPEHIRHLQFSRGH